MSTLLQVAYAAYLALLLVTTAVGVWLSHGRDEDPASPEEQVLDEDTYEEAFED